MRHAFLDRYSRLDSSLHRLPAGPKLASAIALVVTIVVTPPETIWLFGAATGLLTVLATVSRIPWGFLFRRLLLFEPVIVGIALLQLLRPNGFSIFLTLILKSTLSLATMILLSNTTPLGEILLVLKKIRIPSILVTVLALTYRYLFVLIDEAEKMQRARRSRTFGVRKRRVWKLAANVLGQLFVRSSERAERIYAAMSARGWK
jgi:cobalt/nickel transport system permease protein